MVVFLSSIAILVVVNVAARRAQRDLEAPDRFLPAFPAGT
jgi:hypothetical protein